MKTVCKKLFSLLLVAVLLVSAIPFQAFAATEMVGVAIKLNGGDYLDKADIACGTIISKVLPASKTMTTEYQKLYSDGKEFQGWVFTTGAKAGQSVDTSKPLSKDMANEYGWVGIDATFGFPTKNITLNANGGSVAPNTLAVTKGDVYPSLPTPTRSGYSFNGWYTASGNERVDTGAVVQGYENLIAQWVVGTFSVNFQYWNGAEFADSTNEFQITNGKSMKDLGATMPEYSDAFGVRTGYTVDGWADENGNKFTENTKITRDMKVRPNFVANTYTITYDYQCEDLSTETTTIKFGSTVTNLKQPNRANYVFQGWKVAHDGKELKNGDTYLYGDITLVAQWAPKGTVELRVYRDDVDGFKTYYYSGAVLGDELDLNNCKIQNYLSGTYDFDGWFDYNGWVTYKGTGSASTITRIPYVGTSNTTNSTVTVIYGMVKGYKATNTGSNNTSTTAPTSKPADSTNPATGDNSMIYVTTTTMLVSAAALALVVAMRKRKMM